MQSLDISIKMAVGDAHWQLGRVEAHGSIVKKMLDCMDLEHPIRSAKNFEDALIQAFKAKNSLSWVKGYSPEQAVLGVSRKLPGSLTSNADVGSMTLAEGEGPASDKFRAGLELRGSARNAFVEALLRRSRPLPLEVGDWVLYWRGGVGAQPEWTTCSSVSRADPSGQLPRVEEYAKSTNRAT